MEPIETAPRDGTYILLFGPSGYYGTPFRCEIGKYDAEYRPLSPWINHANDSFEDGGPGPTHWAPIPAEKPGVIANELWSNDRFVKIDGKTFRCDCGGNIFRESLTFEGLYRCNSCGCDYRGE